MPIENIMNGSAQHCWDPEATEFSSCSYTSSGTGGPGLIALGGVHDDINIGDVIEIEGARFIYTGSEFVPLPSQPAQPEPEPEPESESEPTEKPEGHRHLEL